MQNSYKFLGTFLRIFKQILLLFVCVYFVFFWLSFPIIFMSWMSRRLGYDSNIFWKKSYCNYIIGSFEVCFLTLWTDKEPLTWNLCSKDSTWLPTIFIKIRAKMRECAHSRCLKKIQKLVNKNQENAFFGHFWKDSKKGILFTFVNQAKILWVF